MSILEESEDDWYINYYFCEYCQETWQDEWDSTCDDECPVCGTVYTPKESVKIR